jgi:hypothetical protein
MELSCEPGGKDLNRPGGVIRKWFVQLQRVFHMLVGLAFLFLSIAGIAVSLKLWSEYRNSPAEGWVTLGMVASFTVLLIVFCLYSFAKARSIH